MAGQIIRANPQRMIKPSINGLINEAASELKRAGQEQMRYAGEEGLLAITRYDFNLKGILYPLGKLAQSIVEGYTAITADDTELHNIRKIDLTRLFNGSNPTLLLWRQGEGGTWDIVQRILTEEQAYKEYRDTKIRHSVGDYAGKESVSVMKAFKDSIPLIRRHLPKTAALAFDNFY